MTEIETETETETLAMIPSIDARPDSSGVPHEPPGFFAAARDWEASTRHNEQVNARRAWFVAGGACLVATATSAALAVLAPFHRVVIAQVLVDRATGDARLIQLNDGPTVPRSEIIDKHWLVEYVLARESYHWGVLQTDYDRVLSMTDAGALAPYRQLYHHDNPVSLDKLLGSRTERRVNYTAVTFPPGETGRAIVHFDRLTLSDNGATVSAPERFIATLAYEYQPATFIKEKRAILNPLGFTVTAYRADPEFAGAAPTPTRSGPP